MSQNWDKFMQKVKKARENLQKVLETLNRILIGYDTINKILLTGIVAHENILLIGPPGVGKTYLVSTLAKLINAKFYKYLLTKFTTDIEVFGMYNLKKLIEEYKVEREWGKIKDADIIFLDEVFKASSPILNSLLSLLNERIIYDPYTGQEIPAKAISVIGASNEVPYEDELKAFYDRFPIRLFVDPIESDELIRDALYSVWLSNHNLSPIASIEDIKVLHQYAEVIIRSEIERIGKFIDVYHANVVPMIKTLKKEGLEVSPRTIIKKLPIYIASACALFGLNIDTISSYIIDIIPYLAKDKTESEQIRNKIFEQLGNIKEVYDYLMKARRALIDKDFKKAYEYAKQVLNFDIEKLKHSIWCKKKIEEIIAQAKEIINFIEQTEKLAQSIVSQGLQFE